MPGRDVATNQRGRVVVPRAVEAEQRAATRRHRVDAHHRRAHAHAGHLGLEGALELDERGWIKAGDFGQWRVSDLPPVSPKKRKWFHTTRFEALFEVVAMGDQDIEQHHDFIQWLFPLNVPSGANRRAPVLSAEDVAEIHASGLAQKSALSCAT